MPREPVEAAALGVLFAGDYGFVLRRRDGAFFLVDRLGPLLARQDGFRLPVHVQGEVVQPAEIDVGGHGSGAEDFQEMLRARFEQRHRADEVEGFILHGRDVAVMGVAALGGSHFIHDKLPGALGGVAVGGAEIREGDLLIQERLPERLVFRVEQGGGGRFVLGAEALLFARLRVFAIEGAVAPIQDEP